MRLLRLRIFTRPSLDTQPFVIALVTLPFVLFRALLFVSHWRVIDTMGHPILVIVSIPAFSTLNTAIVAIFQGLSRLTDMKRKIWCYCVVQATDTHNRINACLGSIRAFTVKGSHLTITIIPVDKDDGHFTVYRWDRLVADGLQSHDFFSWVRKVRSLHSSCRTNSFMNLVSTWKGL